MTYRKRTSGTARPERDLTKEAPLGVLQPDQWHDVNIEKLSVSPTSVIVYVKDRHGDKLDTRLFIREFSNSEVLSPKLKAFMAAACLDSNELMTLVDQLLDGEMHVLGTLVNRSIKCKTGFKGSDIDILRFNKINAVIPKSTRSFFDD